MRSTEFYGLGQRTTKSVVNYYSGGGVSASIGASIGSSAGAREVLSGALTAATPLTLLTVSGAGNLTHLVAYAKDITARTIRLIVIVDGQAVPCFDATTDLFSASYTGLGAVFGGMNSGIVFSKSLEVKVASSNTETDKIAISYILETKQ